MLGRISPELFEVVIHLHVPMFHMEHCLFAAFLSNGRDYRDCGGPCRRRVELRDRVGAEHPATADAGCRNTVFHAAAQSAVEHVQEMKRVGIQHFRLEMLRESGEEARALLDFYGRLLAGLEDGRAPIPPRTRQDGPCRSEAGSGHAAWRQLQEISRSPLTRGTFKS